MSRGWGTPCPFSSRLSFDVEISVSAATSSRVRSPRRRSKLGAEAPPREQRSLWGRHLATLRRRQGRVEATRLLQRPRPPGGTGTSFLNGIDGVNVTASRRCGIPSRFLPAGETRAIACEHAVAGRNLDMRDAARNVPSWDGCHETATVRRTNHVRMSSAGVSADAPPGGTTGMRHDREPPPRGAPRLAAHGEQNRRGRPDRAGGQAGSASAPRTLRRAEGNTHDERYARPPPAQRMVEPVTESYRRSRQRGGRRRRPESRVDGHRGPGHPYARIP